jgi:hypothetical protein
MKKTYGISLVVLALAIVLGFSIQDSFAHAPGEFKNISLTSEQTKELRQMRRDIEDRRFDLMELFAEKTVDADKAKVLHKEIQDLRNKMSDFRLDVALAHKQANPDWQPSFGGKGKGKSGKNKGHGHGGRNWPCPAWSKEKNASGNE